MLTPDNQEKSVQIILQTAASLSDRTPLIIAIDGPCGSGKTTLAAHLARELDAQTVHLDDFYLQPFQRTPQRLAQPGGNLDRERLLEQVLIPLKDHQSCEYQIFDCSCLALTESRQLNPEKAVIVEGSYALHPDLSDYYDLKIVMTIPKPEQIRRLKHREPAFKMEMFINRWIPMEENYHKTFRVFEQANILI